MTMLLLGHPPLFLRSRLYFLLTGSLNDRKGDLFLEELAAICSYLHSFILVTLPTIQQAFCVGKLCLSQRSEAKANENGIPSNIEIHGKPHIRQAVRVVSLLAEP